jgi:hypothetical protein
VSKIYSAQEPTLAKTALGWGTLRYRYPCGAALGLMSLTLCSELVVSGQNYVAPPGLRFHFSTISHGSTPLHRWATLDRPSGAWFVVTRTLLKILKQVTLALGRRWVAFAALNPPGDSKGLNKVPLGIETIS